jgi:glycine/D-amino acid oxidase-like deaminating enzyme
MAVVGAGAFGSWIALQAVRAGFETILVDQDGPANDLSSSGGSSRIIRRAYGPDEIYTLLANRSLELWKAFLSAEIDPIVSGAPASCGWQKRKSPQFTRRGKSSAVIISGINF